MYNELSILDSIINDVLAGTCASTNAVFVPSVDVKDTKKSYVIDMDLPGRSENDVNIELDRNVLTVSSKKEEKKADKDDKAEKYLLRERKPADFKRSFNLPEDADSEAISASFKNGVLTVEIAKKEIAAPRKITIQAA